MDPNGSKRYWRPLLPFILFSQSGQDMISTESLGQLGLVLPFSPIWALDKSAARTSNPFPRSILATDNVLRAEGYVADLNCTLSFYFLNFMDLYRNRRILKIPKPDLNVANDNLQLDYVIRSKVTVVNVGSALDQLVALCEWW